MWIFPSEEAVLTIVVDVREELGEGGREILSVSMALTLRYGRWWMVNDVRGVARLDMRWRVTYLFV